MAYHADPSTTPKHMSRLLAAHSMNITMYATYLYTDWSICFPPDGKVTRASLPRKQWVKHGIHSLHLTCLPSPHEFAERPCGFPSVGESGGCRWCVLEAINQHGETSESHNQFC